MDNPNKIDTNKQPISNAHRTIIAGMAILKYPEIRKKANDIVNAELIKKPIKSIIMANSFNTENVANPLSISFCL